MAAKKTDRRGLGRGLSALMADVNVARPDSGGETRVAAAEQRLPIESVYPNPDQPRRDFPRAALEELAASIREKGVIQPLIVRPRAAAPKTYEIVAGERRWRAAQLAMLHDVPVIVRDLTDTEVLEVAIIENVQRADLNAIEEAMGYRQLIDRFGHTQEKVAEALSKSRSHIANLMRLVATAGNRARLCSGRKNHRRTRPRADHGRQPGRPGAPGDRRQPVGAGNRKAGEGTDVRLRARSCGAPARRRTPIQGRWNRICRRRWA